MSDLHDINVWLALVDQRHVHRSATSRYWAESGMQSLALHRVTANGFLRLPTHTKVLPNPLSPHEAWITYQQFLSIPIIRWLPEPPELDTCCRALTCVPAFKHHLWTDANLAALAMTTGCRLVCFDGDSKRFAGLSFLHLAASL